MSQLFPDICPHCKKAQEMQQRGEAGHVLRFRKATNEWVHDFSKPTQLTHAYCLASRRRNGNG